MLNRFIISAPFGNHFNWPHATSTLGTFTREYRGGPWRRLWRMFLTLRYYHGIQAWKNKLGLPNPGIDWLEKQVARGKIDVSDKIVSVSAHNDADWYFLIEACKRLRPAAVECNVSCPNCPSEKDRTTYTWLYNWAGVELRDADIELIVKLPPVGYQQHVWDSQQQTPLYHACNTLPTPGGGLSGKPLKAVSMSVVAWLQDYTDPDSIIGGGGITSMDDVRDYEKAGADRFAVGSALFFPWLWPGLRKAAWALSQSK